MVKHRDRHQRGMRGPLALPNPLTGAPVPIRARERREDVFLALLHQSVDRIGKQCPQALVGIDIGVEDVPSVENVWSQGRAPLAAAMAPTADRPGQIVVYRRPLEHRAATRKELRVLLYRTIVGQLAAITNRSIDEIDPRGLREQDDWD